MEENTSEGIEPMIFRFHRKRTGFMELVTFFFYAFAAEGTRGILALHCSSGFAPVRVFVRSRFVLPR